MKAFETGVSNSPMVTRYAFMKFMADCSCAALLFGKIALRTSDDRLAMLIILFNTIAIAGRGIVSLFADHVRNKHQGVQLSVMLLFIGFVWPAEFGITAKVILTAVGNCCFHAFASSSVLSRSKFRAADIGFFAAGGVLGIAIARYAPFFGYLAVAFLMMAAAPSDKGEALTPAYENRLPKAPKTRLAPLFLVFLPLCAAILSYIDNATDFSWNKGKKVLVLIAFAAAAGRILGGILFDRLSVFLLAASLGGGAALLLFCGDSKMISLFAILLLNMTVPAVLSLTYRFLPRYPGFSYSLVSGASYLGYLAVNLYPDLFRSPKAMLPILCGTVLLVTVAAETFLIVKSHRAEKEEPKEVSAND